MRPDGVLEIDAHYLLRTDADEPIEVRSIGLRKASPEVAARIAAGEPVDPSEYYFRIAHPAVDVGAAARVDERPPRGGRRASGGATPCAIDVHELL